MSKIITPYELDGSGDRFETVAVGGSSGQSAAITTTRIGIVNPLSAASAADIVYVAFGTNPTATTSSFALPTGMSEFNIVSGWKVAVISGGTTSKITIVELV
jgi:hypothetical protein